MPLLLLLFYFTIIIHFALLVVYPMLRNSGYITSNDFPTASMTSISFHSSILCQPGSHILTSMVPVLFSHQKNPKG